MEGIKKLSRSSQQKIKQIDNCLNAFFVEKIKIKNIIIQLLFQLENQIKALKQNQEIVKNQIRSEKQEIQRQTIQIQQYKQTITELRNSKDNIERQLIIQQQQNKNQIYLLAQTFQQQKQLQLKKLNETLQNKIIELTENNSNLQIKNYDLRLSIEELKMKYDKNINAEEAEQQNNFKKKYHEQLQSIRLRYQNESQKLQDQIKRIKQQYQHKLKQQTKSHERILLIQAQQNKRKELQITQLKKEKQDLKKYIANFKKQYEIKLNQMSKISSVPDNKISPQISPRYKGIKIRKLLKEEPESPSKLQQNLKNLDNQVTNLKKQIKSLEQQITNQLKLDKQQFDLFKNMIYKLKKQKQGLELSQIFNLGKIFCLFFKINLGGKQLLDNQSNKLLQTHEKTFNQLISKFNNEALQINQSEYFKTKESIIRIYEYLENYIREQTRQNQQSIMKSNSYPFHTSFNNYFKTCLQRFYESNNLTKYGGKKNQQKDLQQLTIKNTQSLNLLELSDSKYNKIRSLNLFNCNLTDQNSELLKIWFMAPLQKLDLSGNLITDKFIQNIQSLLPQLTNLNLCFTGISNISLRNIGFFMGKCRVLDLSYTNISEKGIQYLNSLYNLQQLMMWSGTQYYPDCYKKYLQQQKFSTFKKNTIKISEVGVNIFLESLNLKKLYINLCGQALNESILNQIPTLWINANITFAKIKNLIYRNKIQDIQVQYVIFQKTKTICNIIEGCRKSVYYQKRLQNKMKGIPTNVLSIDLKPTILKLKDNGYRYFEQLNLPFNNLKNEGAIQIAENFKNLKNLNLSSNQINNEGVISIADNLIFLKKLDLSNNQISNEGAQKISEKLLQLQQLNLNENQIDHNGAIQLMKQLKKLRILCIQGNLIHQKYKISICNINQTVEIKF